MVFFLSSLLVLLSLSLSLPLSPGVDNPLGMSADIRVFHKYTTLAIMPILASEVLLRENKKSSNKMLPLVGIEPLA